MRMASITVGAEISSRTASALPRHNDRERTKHLYAQLSLSTFLCLAPDAHPMCVSRCSRTHELSCTSVHNNPSPLRSDTSMPFSIACIWLLSPLSASPPTANWSNYHSQILAVPFWCRDPRTYDDGTDPSTKPTFYPEGAISPWYTHVCRAQRVSNRFHTGEFSCWYVHMVPT